MAVFGTDAVGPPSCCDGTLEPAEVDVHVEQPENGDLPMLTGIASTGPMKGYRLEISRSDIAGWDILYFRAGHDLAEFNSWAEDWGTALSYGEMYDVRWSGVSELKDEDRDGRGTWAQRRAVGHAIEGAVSVAEMNVQDEIAPMLTARGFNRSKKVFRRSSSGGLGMTVWLNPENRLQRVRTVSVDCWTGDDEDAGWLYSFDQARAVSEIERGQAWASFDYTPEVQGWPGVIVEDFKRVTVPFIDACTDPSALCELLLAERVPPSNMKQAPLGWVQDVWNVAGRSGLSEYRATALAKVGQMPLTVEDHKNAFFWAGLVGIEDLVLSPPVEKRRRWPLRSRRHRS